MLRSVLPTSLSGISAANLAINVSANNLANSQTDGFRASRTVLADQPPRTVNPGSPAADVSSGGNPTQIGLGVQVAGIEADSDQGTLTLSGERMDLALEGDALFALEGQDGEQVFTRQGRFQFNENGEIVSEDGLRVVGFNVHSDLAPQDGQLEPLQVPAETAGSKSGVSGVTVDEHGIVRGRFPDGEIRELGRIPLAEFANPDGLAQNGNTTFSATDASGLPKISSESTTRIVSGARELSNTEISGELVNLSRYSTMVRANAQATRTAEELLDDLLNLTRR